MKKKKYKKLNIKIFLLALCLVFIIIYCFFSSSEDFLSVGSYYSENKYPIINENTNKNYSGVGKGFVNNEDGYSSTFTTNTNKVYKEFKQNGNSSWSNLNYWDGTMSDNGCGITAISIILSGYNIDYTPEDLRQKYYPVLNGDSISSELSNTFNINNSDFLYDSEHISANYIENYLLKDKPVLICVWDKPTDNRWTTASHYMVLLASDNNGKVYVSNPNGLENTYKSSGWYPIEEVTSYIAKALFVY